MIFFPAQNFIKKYEILLNIIKIYSSNIYFFKKVMKFFIIILIMLIYYYSWNKTPQICFCSKAREENRYARQLIEYYLKLGVNKFIFCDNNLKNKEKLSDVIKDYIDKGLVDIHEYFGSKIGQSEFFQKMYIKYKMQCNWFLFFDFDEYLYMHSRSGIKINHLNDFLKLKFFRKCEAILFNWLIYSDNDLVYYDNRTFLERFPEPVFGVIDNTIVKPIVRGGLNKTIFYPKSSNHIPNRKVISCDSMGRLIKYYNPFFVSPPVYNYAFIKHFTTKTAEEYCNKIKRGANRNLPYDIDGRIKLFFKFNKIRENKIKIFENVFNKNISRKQFKEGLRLK